ncbi:hypothetical protein B0O80DRAFT_502219 [Mortierella sp. GBAus27b]|nr:hypothetical protein B0O80DRAFT_502219 [Mortierella sp. GBAus27b]
MATQDRHIQRQVNTRVPSAPVGLHGMHLYLALWIPFMDLDFDQQPELPVIQAYTVSQ